MKVVTAALALVGGAACDQVFGLPDRPTDATIGDAGPAIHVTGTFTRTAILTNPQHVPYTITTAPTAEDRPVVTSFGQPIPIDWNVATGAFTFDAPVPYEVAIGPIEWQSSASMLAIDDVQAARPDATSATAVTLSISLAGIPGPTSEWDLISTGVWTRTPITIMPSGSVPFDWTTSNFYGLAPRLLSSSAGDTLYLATYGDGPLSFSRVLNESAQATIEMREGSQDVTFNSTFIGVLGCNSIVPTSKNDLDRLADTYPSNQTAPVGGWQIDAVPAPELGVRLPHTLYNRYSDTGDNEVAEPHYGSPYTGFPIILTQTSSINRFLDEVLLAASAVYQDRITPGGSPCPVTPTGGANAALPVMPMLAGVPLKNDNLTLGAGSADYAELTWQTIGDLPDLYIVELFEVPGGLLIPVRVYVTSEPRVRIAKRALESGKRYITRISTRSGRPGASDGDFTRRDFPSWSGVAFTTAFTFVQ